MARRASITAALLLATLSLTLWLGLINTGSIAAQAAPDVTIQSLIDAAPDGGTVNVAAGTYTESLTVNKTLTLTGVSSATTTIMAVTGQRVITVTAGHNLRLENLTVSGGQAIGSGGGGILAAGGNLQIINCRIVGNSAEWGGGLFQEGGSGHVDVIGSRIERNSSGSQGGGMFVRGSAALTNTLVLSNTAGLYGGGLHVDSGPADLNGGLFQNNVALNSNGGAINLNNSLSITNTQFISNTANGQGGALNQWNPGYQVTLANAWFERNTAKSLGGGVYVSSTVTVINSTFESNTVNSGNANATAGGGLYAGSASHITGTLFDGNSALCNGCSYPIGGGLYNKGGPTTLYMVTFSGNLAQGSNVGTGGGMYSEGNTTLQRTIFRGNRADGWGGGLYLYNNNVTASNVLFSGNKAAYGGGVFDISRTFALTQCTFGGNNALSGSALYGLGSSATLLNCIAWGNSGEPQLTSSGTLAVTYSDIQFPSMYTGTGNLNANPLFVAPITGTLAPTTTGNYHLQIGSPAIDKGTNSGVSPDLDGVTRPQGNGYDMGAYETPPASCYAQLLSSSTTYTSTDATAVQSAVDAAPPGDTVKIAGTCAGAQLRAGITQTVYITKSLIARGGYTTTNWITPNPIANPTVLDAQQAGRVIYLAGSGVSATLENLIMRGGLNNSGGGGVYNNGSQVTLANVIVRDNAVANGYGGGGLCVSSFGTLTVTASLVTGNTASYGGGIFNGSGKLVLINSTLSGNQSSTGDPSLDGGGAIDQWGAAPSATIFNSTIVSNTAVITNVARSGIWLEAGTLAIQNSIVANNGVTNNIKVESPATFTSLGYNLTNSSVGTPLTAMSDLTSTNPLIGPLQNNGGATWTHALLPGSPAIDRIPFGVNGCGTTLIIDQRGQPRPGTFTQLCDIGAYEAQGIYHHVYLPVVIK